MNSLSWFLYFADVLPSISSMIGVTSTVLGVILGIVSCIVYIGETENGDPESGVAFLKLAWFKILPIIFFFIVLSLLVPSKETIYLIAGSEAGEAVVTSEQGQEVLNDIHEVIKYQLESLKGGDDG